METDDFLADLPRLAEAVVFPEAEPVLLAEPEEEDLSEQVLFLEEEPDLVDLLLPDMGNQQLLQ